MFLKEKKIKQSLRNTTNCFILIGVVDLMVQVVLYPG